jgi:putative membrane protein insertion efficiency factor
MLTRLLIFFVRAYQVLLGPLLGNCCRFEPSCSRYCIEALQMHGPWRGSWLAVRRLLRCRPFGPCGHDPVPPPVEKSKNNPHHCWTCPS